MPRIQPPIPASKSSHRSISKLEQLTEIQQRKNEHNAIMKQRALRLRNSVLFPSRKRKSSFYSATASSQAKKKRVMEAPTQCIKNKQKQQRVIAQRAFVSHYDRLKKQRNEKKIVIDPKVSMIHCYKQQTKKSKNTKMRLRQKRTLTAPKTFQFATSNRMKDRRMRLIEEQKQREENAENERLARLKKEKLQRMKRVKAMRRTKIKNKKTASTKQPQIKSVKIKRRHSRQRSVSGLSKNNAPMSPKSKRKRVKRSMSDSELGSDKKRWNSDKTVCEVKKKKKVKKLAKKRDIKEVNRLIAKKRLRKLKKTLRSGKRLKLTQSKSLDNIKSAYAYEYGSKQTKQEKKSKNESNLEHKLWLTPIHESDKDTIDMAIDQILTEDVTNISAEFEQKNVQSMTECKEESSSIEVEVAEDDIVQNMKSIFQMEVDDEKDDVLRFDGGEIAEILNKATNGNEMTMGLQQKFEKLDHLFSEISEKIDEFDDGTSSFEFANDLINGIC